MELSINDQSSGVQSDKQVLEVGDLIFFGPSRLRSRLGFYSF